MIAAGGLYDKQAETRIYARVKREAVGLLASSGRTIREIAGDLDLGISKLNRWKREQRDAEPVVTSHPDITKDLARLRKENEILRQELDLLKKATAFFVPNRNWETNR